MKVLGNIIIGPSNNMLRMHGIRKRQTKRYPHERKDLPKNVRIKYHTMKNVGCDDELIYWHIEHQFGTDMADKVLRKGKYERRCLNAGEKSRLYRDEVI